MPQFAFYQRQQAALEVLQRLGLLCQCPLGGHNPFLAVVCGKVY